jgi:hypothetical protein
VQREAAVVTVVEMPKKRARVVKVIPNRCEFRGNKTRCTNQISLNLITHCEKHGTEEERERNTKDLEERHARWCSVRDSNKIMSRINRHARKMRVKDWVNYHKERFANEKATNIVIWSIKCHGTNARMDEWMAEYKENKANERATEKFKALMGL